MTTTTIAIKTYPDSIIRHAALPVDAFEVAIRPVIFGQETSLETQLQACEPIKDKVSGIHGSIYREGVNCCDPAAVRCNKQAFEYVRQATLYFPNSQYSVFHPGHLIANTACNVTQAVSFIRAHPLPKGMIEFEPFFSYKERLVFPLHTVAEWADFSRDIGRPIVIDTAHCFITACALGYDYYDYMEALVAALRPTVFHISTTDASDGGKNDKHLHLYDGVIDFKRLAPLFVGHTCVLEVNDVTPADIAYFQDCLASVPAAVAAPSGA